MTLTITTLSILDLFMTLSINGTQNKGTQHNDTKHSDTQHNGFVCDTQHK